MYMNRLNGLIVALVGVIFVIVVLAMLRMRQNREIYTMREQTKQDNSVIVNRVLAMVMGLSVVDSEEIGRMSGKWIRVEDLYEAERRHKVKLINDKCEIGLLVFIDIEKRKIDVKRKDVLIGSATWSNN